VRELAEKTRAGLQGRKVKSVVGTGVDYEINPYAISVWLGYLIPLFGAALRVQSVSPPKSGPGRPSFHQGNGLGWRPMVRGRQEMLAYAQVGEISAGIIRARCARQAMQHSRHGSIANGPYDKCTPLSIDGSGQLS